ncbi:MAG: aldehyde oxidase [Proteobacteria bacterium SG_bin5]|nr:MAG: aldehyde oxidase [Proteobacteria bacterium SG_bin5]
MARLPLIDRRGLLIAGGAGVGLVVAWGLWPRAYTPNLTAAPGETIFGAWAKIGEDGHVAVAIPQAEYGQGSWTALPQILADELGADWRTVSVEPAPLNPLYANRLAAAELFEGLFAGAPAAFAARYAAPTALMLTAGSSSLRAFEGELRRAGAAARVLLCKAAAKRWGVDWRACVADGGFVSHGGRRARFGELAAEAVREALPKTLPLRAEGSGALAGEPLPRLDVPAKVDGSANFAGDVRLADMVFAAAWSAPPGGHITGLNRAAAAKAPGFLMLVEQRDWVAALATTWWGAHRAVEALAPRVSGAPALSSKSIDAALARALATPGVRLSRRGDIEAALRGRARVAAEYRVGLAPHASLETQSATARFDGNRLELWLPTLAPGLARDAAAAALGIAAGAVTVHPMLVGGSFGMGLEPTIAAQAALIARAAKRPVQLVWSRREELARDPFRAPAVARLTARLGANGTILGWRAKIATPASGTALAQRLFGGDPATRAALLAEGEGDMAAVAGAIPYYRFPAFALDHHPAEIGLPTGYWRGGAHGYTAFFTESFLDELAQAANSEPLSFRVGITGEPRLVRCLSTAASLGGWEGGVPGSGQGIACHSFRGSHIAVLAEAHFEEGRVPVVDRLVAAVDCGRQINPELVRQQIEGGLIFGMSAALGAPIGFERGRPAPARLGALELPTLADTPDITVELIRSDAEPGGVSELAVPPVAPAIANALHAATGFRLRALPFTAAA